MPDIKTEIHQFEVKEAEIAKAWMGTNLVPLGVGLVIGIVVTVIIHHL